ncbi:MAG: COG2426 family protein [Bacillota bacterium]
MVKIVEWLIAALAFVPVGLRVALLAMLPIAELRAAIPLALAWGMSPVEAFLIAVPANMVPALLLLLALGPITTWLQRYPLIGPLIRTFLSRAARQSDRVKKYGALGLAIFVAIPAPVTGAWTGSGVAFLLGIPFKFAFPAIFAGVVIAGVLVSLASLGLISLYLYMGPVMIFLLAPGVLFFAWRFARICRRK